MATRSFIMDKVNDIGIYCHWDGYPEHNGVILDKFYDTQEKVDLLMSLGDISVLGVNIEAGPSGSVKIEGKDCSFAGHTVAYHRDNGELYSTVKARTGARLTAMSASDSMGAEYIYSWNGNKWNVVSCHKDYTADDL